MAANLCERVPALLQEAMPYSTPAPRVPNEEGIACCVGGHERLNMCCELATFPSNLLLIYRACLGR